MGSLPDNSHSSAIVARAKGILLDPTTEWQKISVETDQPMQVFLRYVLPLAAIGPIASFIGMQVFGLGMFGISIRFGLMDALTIAVVSFVMSLVSVWVMAYVANFLSPKFGGRDDLPAAFRLVAYSWTASWVAGIFGIVPMLSFLSLLGLYSFYLLFKGVTPMMGVPQDKAVGYTVVTVVAAIIASVIVSMIVAQFTAPLLTAGMTDSAGQMSIDMGANGSIESSADGTMTITGPDGEQMTISVDDKQ